jgi:hypothetical protein
MFFRNMGRAYDRVHDEAHEKYEEILAFYSDAIRMKDRLEMIGWINLQEGTKKELGVGISIFL